MLRNIGLVLRREYFIRVKNKVFLLITFLAPIGFALLVFLPILVTTLTDNSEIATVWVKDPTNQIIKNLHSDGSILFVSRNNAIPEIQQEIQQTENQYLLILPEDITKTQITATLYAAKPLSLSLDQKIRSKITEAIQGIRLSQINLTSEQLSFLTPKVDLNTLKISAKSEQSINSIVAAGIGYAMSMIIYLFLVIYGTMVMRGVMEEKQSRIVEIIVSSIRPIELMMGKIMGIALVGLTQIAIWLILMILIVVVGAFIMGITGIASQSVSTAQASPEQINQTAEIIRSLQNFNISIIFYFLFYFLFGYLLYGSILAAIGSAIDQETDSQQFVSIIFIPLVLPILFIPNILQYPNGVIATIGSLVPLFSPVVMMMRLASIEVPFWQIGLSILLLIAGVFGTIWLAARIYRVGILMYGKKPTWKDLSKWVFVNH
ncbi:MAG: ABC transporter permease [Bacteroidia bacterium]|nr:ABC transporter permease [Bacteroidia bacterium]